MRRPRHARLARVLALSAAVSLTAACGIDADGAPRNIPVDQRGQLEPDDAAPAESSGASRVFLLVESGDDGQRLLRSVLRDVPSSPTEVLRTLFAGPNDMELQEGLLTALPPEVQLRSARSVAGILNVNLSPEILELQSSLLQYAVAQIVYTSDELEGVRAVRLRVDGQIRQWPAGRGDLSEEPLTVYDFPGFAESAQPAYPSVPSDP